MPTLKDFGGFKIRMFFHDHNPPHVHVMGTGFNVLVSIADGATFRGIIPASFRAEALSWVAANRDFLMTKWAECQE